MGRVVRVAVLTIALVACGGDDAVESGADPTRESGASAESYCSRVNDWADAISAIDGTSAASVMAGLAEATSAARAVVDSAPAEMRDEHEHIASAAEDLLAGLEKRHPQSRDELDAAHAELSTELTTTYPELEDESRRVELFAERECGRKFG